MLFSITAEKLAEILEVADKVVLYLLSGFALRQFAPLSVKRYGWLVQTRYQSRYSGEGAFRQRIYFGVSVIRFLDILRRISLLNKKIANNRSFLRTSRPWKTHPGLSW